jgi:hypothetical protein
MEPLLRHHLHLTRRQFFGRAAGGIGAAVLGSLLRQDGLAANTAPTQLADFAPKAKRVIVLWQGGAPSQVDLFDYKPGLEKLRLTELPESVRGNIRLSTMTASQGGYPVLPAIKPFRQYGQSGRWLSELIPHTGSIADEICLIHSMHTDAVNHAPGVTFFLTGSQIPGRPSLGAWTTYGLGSLTDDLSDREKTCGQLFFDHYWGSGFVPSKYQGVRFRGEGDPVLYLTNPEGMSRQLRRSLLDDLAELNQQHLDEFGDPEIDTRITQYEMAYRMQASVPELTDISSEPASVLEMYGPDVHRSGSFARNCLLARRLVERGTRFVQLMHAGWDQHNNLPTQLEIQCRDTDQPSAALVKDLKQRGLLDDTVVIWASEFGRTVFVQGDITKPAYGRDHFGACYSMWVAGGGFRPGHQYGETDEYCYNIVKDPVGIHDFQATLLHQLGLDHEKLTFRHQGRNFRLTDVEGTILHGLLG